jgi:TP901 family phage tail tape measure protein
MAEEIINKLGFDVSQALQALDALDAKMKTVGETMKQFAKTTAQVETSSSAVDKIDRAFKGLGDAKQSVDRLTVSWGYLTSRILYTQMVVSYFGKFRRTLEEAGESAVDYQRRIAEITTISDLSQAGAGGIVRNLADQYNVPLLEEAAGLYQTLSNGITNAAEATQFLAEANKFAKATNSSTANSVDLLSGAIKSFGMSTEDTGKAAGVLFEAIRAGRITASELGPTFGRVAPRAAQLGLSLEETAGALAAITVKGVKTSEAITQLGGVLTALTKPTDTMAANLHKLGFSSGEAAVATLKLPGLLQALADSTDGSSATLAKMFPNVRGIAGQLALTGKGLKEFAADVAAMEKAGANLAASKYLQVTATDSERVTKELGKLKNAMTVDLGQSVLRTTADLSDFVGGANSVIQVAKAGGPALIGLGAGFLTLRGSIMAAKLEAVGLSKALGALALIPIAYGAGKSIGQYLDSSLIQQAEAGLKQLEDANAKALDEFKRQQSEKRDAASKADDARIQSSLQTIQRLNIAYLSDLDNAKRANAAMVKNAEAGLHRILTTRERLVAELAKAAAEANDAIKSSQQRIGDLKNKSQDREFSRSISPLDDAQKAFALSGRAREIASQAANDLARATDKEAISRALQQFTRAERTGEEAAQIAERTGNRTLEAKAAQTLHDITQKQIAAEKQLQQVQARRVPILEKERDIQQASVDQMRAAIKTVLDNSNLFDKQGNTLPADQLAKQAAARQEAMKQLSQAALSQRDLTAMQALGVADFINRFQADLSPIKLTFDIQQGVEKAQADIQAAFSRFKVGFDVKPLEAALGRKLNSPDEVARGLAEAKQKAAELRSTIDAAFSNQPAVRNLQSEIDKILQGVDQRKGGRNTFQGDYSDNLRKQFDSAMAEFNRVRGLAKITEADIQSVFDKFKAVRESASGNVVGRLGFGTDLVEMEEAFRRLRELQGLQGKMAPDPSAVQQLQELERVIQGLQVLPELGNLGPAIGVGVQPSADIAANLDRAAMSAASIASNLATASLMQPTGFASGGVVRYLAAGGPSGTDTVPAMLSPGEFVMNAMSSRKFASQLVAMNAGVPPVYRNAGGTVNTTIGDIHVHGASQPEATARAVMTQIRRELRRGTGAL